MVDGEMKYVKINTIWKREEKTGKIIPGDYSKAEIPNIKMWQITEKIHGTNSRVTFERKNKQEKLLFGGKTDDAQISVHLLYHLQDTFKIEDFKKIWDGTEDTEIILFGEGYGPKIQKGGGRYRDDASFILFDVWIDGWWLEPHNVKDIANKLGIEYVPELGIMSEEDAISIVENQRPNSKIAQDITLEIEGIVARAYPMVLFRDGTPAMWKLKVRDFKEAK